MAPSPVLLAVPDLAAYLVGAWTVEREIDDRRQRRRGTFSGEARFVPGDGAIDWVERGTLRLEAPAPREGEPRGAPVETAASRRLRIVPTPRGGWEVRFEDGHLFHPLDLRDGACEVDHPCRADRYAGRYEVLGPDAFLARWTVAGPQKDHLIASTYRR